MNDQTYRIVIIDDSASDRKIFRRFLERMEGCIFDVEEAADVPQALEICRRSPPDCVLLDFKLPGRNGLRALPEIRELSGAPVVFISGQPEPLVPTEAYRLGAVRYLSKDCVTSAILQRAVMDALGESQLED